MISNNDIFFLGNGPLADFSKATLKKAGFNILFHAHSKSDLENLKLLKAQHPTSHGILASFGSLIKTDLLDLFEPEGILNIHPSKLPDLRGPSPIETAILRGDTSFSVSIMKLVKAFDAGPIYYQTTLELPPNCSKSFIYQTLAETGSNWITKNLHHLPTPTPQDEKAVTFSQKLTKSLSPLDPSKPSLVLLNEIRAYQGFPKSKFTFFDTECIILEAHVSDTPSPLSIKCSDEKYLCIDRLQPASRKPMDAKSFLNGVKK